jgi:hypothetical protein
MKFQLTDGAMGNWLSGIGNWVGEFDIPRKTVISAGGVRSGISAYLFSLPISWPDCEMHAFPGKKEGKK